MKKLLLATAVTALAINAAQAAPTVYGKLHVTVDSIDKYKSNADGKTDKSQTSNVWEVNSNASRIGIKGDEKLSDVLTVVYLAEWQINTDGDGDDLSQRNRYVGLKYDNIGTVKVGKIDSFVKLAGGKNDIFNDLNYLDMTKLLAGENRLNNVVTFESDPKLLGNLQLNLLLQQGEGKKLSDNSQDSSDGLGDAVSASLVYDNKNYGVYASLSGDKNVVSTFNAVSAKAEADIIRVAGVLDLGKVLTVPGLSVGALYQTAQPQNVATGNTTVGIIDKENAFLLQTGYKIPNTPWGVKAQYQQAKTTFETAADDVKLSQFGGMVDYAFNSKTRAYGYLAQQQDNRSNVDDRNYVGLGLEFNF
ncbi:porin [Alkanindiges sp. WGS2144]|uniref:porin n=1 Tax=Alkanindiges sp. WGS2144 TaxID=3366808 RepID=UPI003751F24A